MQRRDMNGGSIVIHSPQKCRELNIVHYQRQDEIASQTTEQPANHVITTSPQRSLSRDGERAAASRESGRLSRTGSRDMGRLSRTCSRDVGLLSRLSSAAQMANVQTWLSQKARRSVVALPESPELKALDEACNSLLQEEKQLLTELEAIASNYSSEANSKREMLYHKWNTRVYTPLHSKITMTMTGTRYSTLDKEKRTLFQKYLNYCNKQSVFLETMSSTEYNPLSLTDHNTQLTAVTDALDDPLLTQQTDRNKECHITTGSHGNDETSIERGLDAVRWLAIKLVDIDSKEREKSRCRVKRDHNEMQKDGGQLILPHKTPQHVIISPSNNTHHHLTWNN